MKPLNKIIDTIHSLPEGVRKLFASSVLAIAAILLFLLWSGGFSSEVITLDPKSLQDVSPGFKDGKEKLAEVLSPAAGLGESFKSLNQFWEGVSLDPPSGEAIEKQAGIVLQSFAGIWNVALDKVWRWVYAP